MEDIIKDEFFGELKYKPNIGSWVGITDAPLYNSEGNLKLVVQDLEKEGILDVQREAYKTYLQNADKYKEIAVDYLLDYYKWNYEYIASEVSGVNEKDHKDVVTETQLFEFMTLCLLHLALLQMSGRRKTCFLPKVAGMTGQWRLSSSRIRSI